jgi:HEAT repeat protein
VEALRTALRDPSWLVRRAAVSALGTLRAGVEVIAAVEVPLATVFSPKHSC